LPTVCSALALAACGGEQKEVEQRTVSGPTIERAVAARLASRSEKVASLLDAGEACGAKREAALLRNELTAAINDGKVPSLYLEDLSGVVNEIQAQMPLCAELERRDDDDENGKGHGKGHGKGKGKKKDDDE
jgi:bacterioferritin-associated ferredoxin